VTCVVTVIKLTVEINMSEVRRRVDVLVRMWIDADADVTEVIQEMDYHFEHSAIAETEIVDVKEF